MSKPWAFLESEEALLAEAYAAGVAAAGKGPERLFTIWKDLQGIFRIRKKQRYAYLAGRVRARFIDGVKSINLQKFVIKGEKQ